MVHCGLLACGDRQQALTTTAVKATRWVKISWTVFWMMMRALAEMNRCAVQPRWQILLVKHIQNFHFHCDGVVGQHVYLVVSFFSTRPSQRTQE